jgi:hypothetical protein
MSYEGEMLEDLRMPSKADVEIHILKALLRHRGVLKEFASGIDIVDELADEFALTPQQRTATLERVYRKENRTVHSLLWHRLLFRAADSLSKSGLVSRPTATLQLSGRREWMLTEKGFDEVLRIEGKETLDKDDLGVRSFEVQKEVKKIVSTPRPTEYNPVESTKRLVTRSSSSYFRSRGFRQAVIEAYDCKCSFCGLKLISPDSLRWEVEAAHIVPNNVQGKDDVWNGLALCGIHHWAFDVGWLTLNYKFVVETSSRTKQLPSNFARIGNLDLLRMFERNAVRMNLPSDKNLFPHENSIRWHRSNRFVP